MPQDRTRNGTSTAADFLTRCFAPGETIALLLQREVPSGTLQRIIQLETALAPRYLGWLAHSTGANVCVAANTLRPGGRKRTKESIVAVRHLYLDLDTDGQAHLTSLRASDAVPTPTAIVSTSLGKYQVLWRVDSFTLEQQESALKLLAITFGGDPACTDCNRVLRLPGFLNCKYDPEWPVTVEYPGDSTWNSDDFRLDILAADAIVSSRSTTPRKRSANHTNSEHDWAWVLHELAEGKGRHKAHAKAGFALPRYAESALLRTANRGCRIGQTLANRRRSDGRRGHDAGGPPPLRDSHRTLLRSCAGDCADGTADDCPEKSCLIQHQIRRKHAIT